MMTSQHRLAGPADRQAGYTLIELMVTIAIIGVLAAIAIPAYQGYISSGKEGTARTNARALAGFLETYYYENDSYVAGEYTETTDTLTAVLDWRPEGDQDKFDYEIAKCDSGSIAECYKITVTFRDDPTFQEVIEKLP